MKHYEREVRSRKTWFYKSKTLESKTSSRDKIRQYVTESFTAGTGIKVTEDRDRATVNMFGVFW